jgi:polyisoprenoid-binding protein YceI
MMRTALNTLVLAVALAVGSSACATPAWIIDKATSSIRFSSRFNGVGFSGAFRAWTADIRFDPANLPASSVSVSVDVASAATGDADRDQALPTAAFFDAAHFPRAAFVAHSFRSLGGGRYVANGTFTLRGVSKPLALPFTLAVAGPKAHMTASLALDRLAFGVGQDEWRKTDVIPAAVGLTLQVDAQRR